MSQQPPNYPDQPGQPYQPYPQQQPQYPQPPYQQPYGAPVPPIQSSQKPPKKPWYRRTGCLIAVGVVAVLLIISSVNAAISGGKGVGNTDSTPTTTTQQAGSSGTTPTTPPTPKPTAKPTPSFITFGDGTFQVGKDIKAGTYRTRTGVANCYYERLSGFDGTLGEIIANQNTDDPAIVTIAASDKGFTSQGCGTWTSDLSQITSSKTSFGGGIYFVNKDINPGTYKSAGSSTCYWERLSGFGGVLDDIIANGNPTGSVIVTIDSGDKGFSSSGCGTWTKVS